MRASVTRVGPVLAQPSGCAASSSRGVGRDATPSQVEYVVMQHELGRDQGGTDRASPINTSECRVADPAIRRRCAARPPRRGDMPRPPLLQDVHLNRGRSEEGCLCRLRGVGHFKPTHVCSNRAQGPARNPQPALIQLLHTEASVRTKRQFASKSETSRADIIGSHEQASVCFHA